MGPNNDQEQNNQTPTTPAPEEITPPEPEVESQPEVEPETPETPEKEPKQPKSKRLIILVVIFAILAAVGIGFGIWGIINANQKPAPAPVAPTDPEPTPEPTDNPDEEVEITDTYVIKDLDEKISVLYGWGDQTGTTIATGHGVHPEFPLFVNGNLSDDAKLSHIGIAMQGSSSTISASTDIVDTVMANFPEVTSGWDWKSVYDELNGRIFAKDKFESKYREVFGSDVPLDALGSSYCPSVYYEESGYYFMFGGCGGTSPWEAYYYKNRYTTNGDHAYVYVNAGVVNLENDKIYCEIFPYSDDYYGDESLACDNYAGGDFTIDASNHDKFAEYRFVFTKADNGTYYFEKVEKVTQ